MADAPTFYIFHGDDAFNMDAALKTLRAGMGDGPNAELNISEFDGEQASVPEVLNAVKSFPFLAERRLVIVKNLISWISRKGAGKTGKQAVETLLGDLPRLPAYARLVMVEQKELSEKNAVIKEAKNLSNGFCKLFKAPKDSTGWIIHRAKEEYEVTIDPPAAAALASVTGEDLRRADNELIKLVSYVGDERPITEADVALLTPYVAEANVFAMVDALAIGDGKKALTLMHRSLNEDPSDPGFRLFALITRQFRLLLLTREHLSMGGSAQARDVAKAVGVSPWQAGKLATQSRSFTVAQLEQIYRRLQQYDLDMKTGRIKPHLALDLLVASLAQSA